MLRGALCKDHLLLEADGNFYFEVEYSEMKMKKETLYELLKDDQKKQLGKNNEVKMTLYNALPRKEAKVAVIEEAKELDTLPLDELIGNPKVYEMVLDNDGIASKTIKEKVKSLALKAKVTREQTSDNSDSQRGSDEEVDEEEAKAFNLMAKNFPKFFRKEAESLKQKGVCYTCGVEGHFASECIKPKENMAFVRVAWSNSEDRDELQDDVMCLMAIDSQEVQTKPSISNNDLDIINLQKENEELLSEKSKLLSKINDLEFEVKKLVNDKEEVEPCKKYDVLNKEVDSLKCNVSRLQNKALNFSKFKRSSVVLDDMLSRQKLSQDKEGLGFSKNEKNHFYDWIVDSGCTKHMTRNRRLLTSYTAYDGGHVVFESNLKGKVVGGGNITHDSITITNVKHVSGIAFNLISVGQLCDDDCVVSFTKLDCTISKSGKTLAKGHMRNGLYTCKLGDNSKQQIFLASMVDNSMLWHRRLGHVNIRFSSELRSEFDKLQFGSFCKQHEMSYNLSSPFTSQSSEIVERTHRKLRKMSRAMLDE
ncbi:protein CHUP1, chloroplastic [Tanacetum coccineum]